MKFKFCGTFHLWRFLAVIGLAMIVSSAVRSDLPSWHSWLVFGAIGAFMPSFLER